MMNIYFEQSNLKFLPKNMTRWFLKKLRPRFARIGTLPEVKTIKQLRFVKYNLHEL